MFEEKHFKSLQNIKVNQDKKHADYEQIVRRSKQKVVHWPIYAVTVSIICITFFLIATAPFSPEMETTALDDKQLTAVYSANGKVNPKSAFQIGVELVTNEEVLLEIQHLYDQLQLTNPPNANSYIHATHRFNFADGTSKLYYLLLIGQTVYYEDASTGQFYKLEDGSGVPLIQYDQATTLHKIVFYSLFSLLIGSFLYVNRQLREQDDSKRKLPWHSHPSQSVMTLIFLVFPLVLIFSFSNIHFIWMVISGLSLAAVNIFLEIKYGQNTWRMLSFFIFGLLVPAYWYLILLL